MLSREDIAADIKRAREHASRHFHDFEYKDKYARIGYPFVLLYYIEETDEYTPVPPNASTHPDPATSYRPPLSSPEAAKALENWENEPRSSFPYRALVLDREFWEELNDKGFWTSPEHTGEIIPIVDNRKAPGA